MSRKIFNDGAAVYGWINIDKQKAAIYSYAKGYIGCVKDDKVYNEKGKFLGNLDNFSIEVYIHERNGAPDINAIKKKLGQDYKKISFTTEGD